VSHSKKQWRQPEPAQLQCEKDLAYHLSMLILSGDIRKHVFDARQIDRESASATIASFLEKAQALGHGYAQQQLARLERSIAGNVVKGGALTWAIEQARSLIDRALSWAKDLFASKVEQLGDDASEEDIEQALEDTAETVSDTLALTEIQDTIEQEVMDVLQGAGVAMIQAVNEPDACDLCVQNAEAGPIPIGTPFPSGHTSCPFHGRCRCHIEAV
jgi:hypothetical protein